MKTITLLLTAIITGLIAHADDTFVPSHRLAAEMRFEAKRSADTFQDYTPALPPLTAETRHMYQERTRANTERRQQAILSRYKQEHQDWSSRDTSSEQPFMDRINQLEQQLIAAVEANKQPPAELTVPTEQLFMTAGVGTAGALLGLTLAFAARRLVKKRSLVSEPDTTL
jgi:hypothetical protein